MLVLLLVALNTGSTAVGNSSSSTALNELISVVLPVYNGMPFLPQAVESVLAQTETR